MGSEQALVNEILSASDGTRSIARLGYSLVQDCWFTHRDVSLASALSSRTKFATARYLLV